MLNESLGRYYKSNTDVQEDRELQAFANEMSADGDAEDGGKVT